MAFGEMMTKLLAVLILLCQLVIPVAHADEPTTYTLEPFLGGAFGIEVTKQQFNGKFCPCTKIDYTADGFHNQEGADAIAQVDFKPGDKLMGFSLGVQVISLYLSQHKLPSYVDVILAGDTFARNQELVDAGQGIPADIENHVEMYVNEYDGWSDKPDEKVNYSYMLALQNAVAGTQRLHYYKNTDPDAPENIRETRGNITANLVPTQDLPQNDWLRPWWNSLADTLDNSQRTLIDSAYSRKGSTPTARAAASGQQVPQPNPPWKK
jgi:hypothetical protein